MSIYLGNTPLTNTGYDKANTDLSNLTSQGKNIANWSNNVTNCITEIPQDIKLELNNGTLTLKAGSKVYVPNGVVFDVVTVPSDVVFHSGTIGTDTFNLMLCCNLTGGFGVRSAPSSFESGTTAPSNTSLIWYDTTNNAVKKYENGSWVRAYSLPIGIYVRTNGVATSIKQVFNGFGYIGSTVFALPGVKGLIPNGRNEDGTLKNTPFTIPSVKTFNNTVIRNNTSLTINQNTNISPQNVLSYDNEKNLNISTNNSVVMVCKYATWNADSTGKITSFTPKTAFHALDYNDSSTISGWAMPSDRYIDLTLGASGSSYTAPANGWFSLAKATTAANQYIFMSQVPNRTSTVCWCPVSGQYAQTHIPIKKGDTCRITYSAAGDIAHFRFTYAEGEN